MGKWRKCDDCPRGFPSLVKLDRHRKDDHQFEILAAHLKWLEARLRSLENAVRRYWDSKTHLESLSHIPPGARELLQGYLNKYDRPWLSGRTYLDYEQDKIPELRRAVDKTRDCLRRATMMRPVP